MVRSLAAARLSRRGAQRTGLGRWLSVLVAVGVLVVAPRASAYSMHIEWNAPAGCPDVAVLRSSIERLLAEPLLEGPTFEARGTVSADADARFTLTLDMRTPESHGTRSVRADTCESIAEVAAFSIALALNPDLALEPPKTAPVESAPAPPEPTPTAPAAPTPPPPVAESPPRTDTSSSLAHEPRPETSEPGPQVWLGAQALGDTSLLPGPAPGVRGSAEVLLGDRVRLGLGGLWLAARTKELGASGGGLFSFWSLEARACGQVLLGVTAAVCPLFRFGELRGEGRGVRPRLSQVSSIYAPGLELLGLYALSPRVSASAGLAGYFPLIRDVFVVNAGRVHRVPAVSVALTLGVLVRAW